MIDIGANFPLWPLESAEVITKLECGSS